MPIIIWALQGCVKDNRLDWERVCAYFGMNVTIDAQRGRPATILPESHNI